MDPVLDEYRKVAKTVKISTSSGSDCQYISGMNGKLIENPGKEINAEYWVRHTRNKVSFMDACCCLRQLGCQNFLEIGPQPVLSSLVMQNIELSTPINCYPSLRRNINDWETILTSLGNMYLQGYQINWEGFDKPYIRKKVSSLPTYPFQRRSFWVDCSDTNVAPIHPLIGHPISNASTLNIFQNSLSIKSVPYLKDHCIGNRIVMPGAAFTEMCLSGGFFVANSLKDKFQLPVRPIALENMIIEAPLELKEEKLCRVQVIVDLPVNSDENNTNDKVTQQSKHGFCVKIFHQKNSDKDANGKWMVHANATFHLVPRTNDLITSWNFERIAALVQEKESPLSNGFYKRISNLGLNFGESFKSIGRHWRHEEGNGNDEIVVEMSIPSDHESYILHPVIIDAMLQTETLTQLRTQTEVLRVPVRIGQFVWLGNVEATGEKNVLYLHAWWSKETGKCNILAVNEDLRKPIAFLSDLEVVETNVKTIESILEQQNSSLPDTWEEVWKLVSGPHSNRVVLSPLEPIFSTKDFSEKVESTSQLGPEDWNDFNQANKLIYLYMKNILMQLGWFPNVGDNVVITEFCKELKILPIYEKLISFYFSVFRDEQLMEYNDNEKHWKVKSSINKLDLENEIQRLELSLGNHENMKIAVKFYQNIVKSLPRILIGNESPIQILFPTDPEQQEFSAEAYYQRHPGQPDTSEKAAQIMESAVQKWRKMAGEDSSKTLKILEVGAGTASTSEWCLPRIRNDWGDNFEYHFTDISAAFFPKAERKLHEFQRNLKFAVFNIEENPLKQGIPINYFDMVIAADVIHATKSLRESVENLKATLRPEGIVIFRETISRDRGITFSFGLFEHYWRFQDFESRADHPCINLSKWKQVLLETGFKYVYATEGYFGTFGIICGETPSTTNEDVEIYGNDESVHQAKDKRPHWIVVSPQNILMTVCNKLRQCNNRVTSISLDTAVEHEDLLEELSKLDVILGCDENVHGIIYAVGMDVSVTDQNTLAKLLLYLIKKLLSVKKPPRLYVFTNGGHGINADSNPTSNPSVATLFGMVKTLKNENSEMFVRYVDFNCVKSCDDEIRLAEEILYELASFKDSKEKDRVQIAYRDGQRYEPRLANLMASRKHGSHDELKLPSGCERYGLVLPASRMIQDLEFDVLEEENVGQNEVEVKVEAYALNFKDIVTILKPIAEFEKFNTVGIDLAGVVTKVCDEIPLNGGQHKFQIGDRVFGINYKENSALPSHVVLKTGHLVKIPNMLTFTEAATLPVVFATSIQCLVNVAQLKAEETVLIHTGSGGVGLSAIQVAKFIGARIITTAGNKRKRSYLREKLGIEHVFHSRNVSFKENILKITNGRGVDVVLNSVTGPGMKEASLDACARDARFVEMSKLSIWTEEEVKALRADVKYTVVDLITLDIDCWTKLLEDMQNYLNAGKIKGLPHVTFDALYIKQALKYFQKATHIGKIVVTMPKLVVRDGEWMTQVSLFNGDSTYVITGGLGGIGFEVCKWMLDKGATDIVLIGRSPPKPEIAKEIQRLQEVKKCKLFVKLGDVGDFEACKAIFQSLTENGCKPIRGVQHCAGVLRDNLYPNQSWNAYEETFNPKVKGTWNLHNLTKDMLLEHFILYSSLAANVGTPSQSSHAAANCFEDAFAHFRYSLGLTGLSINWGQWSQVGCAKEIIIAGFVPVSVQHMLNGLEMAYRTNKIQVTIANFESYAKVMAVCPILKHYMDERLLNNDKKQASFNLPQSDRFWEEMDSAESKEEKMEVACGYIKTAIRSALRMEPNEPIGEDVDIQELGVDSLMAIEVKNSIQSIMGSRLTVTATLFRDCKTTRNLASVLITKIYDDEQTNANQINLSPEEFENLLNNDCLLEDTIQTTSQLSCKVTEMKTVLITGATGQLGPYILSLLSRNQDYQNLDCIICLIRTREGKCPREKLENILVSMKIVEKIDMSKVTCVRGDVALPNFGLEPEKYANLCASVDGVIHLAVKSNHLEMYRNVENGTKDIRSVNVGGTLNVLRFAATTKTKYVYHAGAIISVFGGNDEGTLCDDWPELDQIKAIVEHNVMGYPTSKFVCEMLIKQANERGIPCKVFRFPWVTGESETGRLNYASNQFILRFLSYLKIKAMPDAPIPAIVLPVDICADLSLKLFWNDDTPTEVYNIAHPKPELEMEFMRVAKEHFGREFELVDWRSKEFVAKLYATDMPLEALKEIYQDVDRGIAIAESGAFQAIQGYLRDPENFFKNKKVEKYLPGFSDNISISTMDIIKTNLEFVRNEGFFAKFGL